MNAFKKRQSEKNDGRINVAMPKRLEQSVKQVAEQENTYDSEVVRAAIEFFLQHNYPTLINNISSINKSQPTKGK